MCYVYTCVDPALLLGQKDYVDKLYQKRTILILDIVLCFGCSNMFGFHDKHLAGQAITSAWSLVLQLLIADSGCCQIHFTMFQDVFFKMSYFRSWPVLLWQLVSWRWDLVVKRTLRQ